MTACDVAIIGAGPAGAVAAARLADRGWRVVVLERDQFPRFSIGESLLPQSMTFLEEAGLLEAVEQEGFQRKDGAAFRFGTEAQTFHFEDKSASGWSRTFEVRRDRFDQVLARGATTKGAQIAHGATVEAIETEKDRIRLRYRIGDGDGETLDARFLLDASGFGRVLARAKKLERPSGFPPRRSLFTHVVDRIDDPAFDRNKILISIHPDNDQIWYWLIPLADGLSSIGAVGPDRELETGEAERAARFDDLVRQSGWMGELLQRAEPVRPVGTIQGYAASVSRMSGPGWAMLGNAAEFLDPVFSSGVTIALKSASLAADLVDRQLRGDPVDWPARYDQPLSVGIETFRAFVEAWYEGTLQRIIFAQPRSQTEIKRMIVSVLAGYAWDPENAFVRDPRRYLKTVDALCAPLRSSS